MCTVPLVWFRPQDYDFYFVFYLFFATTEYDYVVSPGIRFAAQNPVLASEIQLRSLSSQETAGTEKNIAYNALEEMIDTERVACDTDIPVNESVSLDGDTVSVQSPVQKSSNCTTIITYLTEGRTVTEDIAGASQVIPLVEESTSPTYLTEFANDFSRLAVQVSNEDRIPIDNEPVTTRENIAYNAYEEMIIGPDNTNRSETLGKETTDMVVTKL